MNIHLNTEGQACKTGDVRERALVEGERANEEDKAG
jgi:hypothetical protein